MSLVQAKDRLETGGFTCVLTDGQKEYTSQCRGVAPLVDFLGQNLPPHLCAADKVVGQATAYLYVLLQVQELFAKVISKPALAVLETYGIPVQYETLVDHIINRKGDGICPFEATVLQIQDPTSAFTAILQKMQEMNTNLHITNSISLYHSVHSKFQM